MSGDVKKAENCSFLYKCYIPVFQHFFGLGVGHFEGAWKVPVDGVPSAVLQVVGKSEGPAS